MRMGSVKSEIRRVWLNCVSNKQPLVGKAGLDEGKERARCETRGMGFKTAQDLVLVVSMVNSATIRRYLQDIIGTYGTSTLLEKLISLPLK
jgi:hypothetical protein